jgi:hypothetical protein
MKNTFVLLLIATALVSCDKKSLPAPTQDEKPIGYIPVYESDIRKFVNNPILTELDKSIPITSQPAQAPSALDAAKKELKTAWDVTEKQVKTAWAATEKETKAAWDAAQKEVVAVWQSLKSK